MEFALGDTAVAGLFLALLAGAGRLLSLTGVYGVLAEGLLYGVIAFDGSRVATGAIRPGWGGGVGGPGRDAERYSLRQSDTGTHVTPVPPEKLR